MNGSVLFERSNGQLFPEYATSAAAEYGERMRLVQGRARVFVSYEYVYAEGEIPFPWENGGPCEGMVVPVGELRVTLNGSNVTSNFNLSNDGWGNVWSSATNLPLLDPGMNDLRLVHDAGWGETQLDRKYAYNDAHPLPSISASSQNGENVDPARCFANCFEVVSYHSSPAYVSMGVPRTWTMVYRSGRAAPRGEVSLELGAQWGSGTAIPARVGIRLRNPGASTYHKLIGDSTEAFFTIAERTGGNRLGVQFEASHISTGVYAIEVVATAYWNDGVSRALPVITVPVIINNERNSEYGAGWMPLELQRLAWVSVPQGALIVTGAGAAQFFTWVKDSAGHKVYRSPKGDFSRLLFNTQTGKVQRLWKDSSRVQFDGALGRIDFIEDRFGNRVSFMHTGARLDSVVDPTGHAYRVLYNEPNPWGLRVGAYRGVLDKSNRFTGMSIDLDNRAVSLIDPDDIYTQLQYDVHRRLTRYTDRRGSAWRFGYDHAGRVAADSTPLVGTAENGSVHIVTRYQSAEKLFMAPPTAVIRTTPHAAPANDAILARHTAPAGATTEVVSDRLGNPIITRTAGVPNTQVTVVRDEHGRPSSVSGPKPGETTSIGWTDELPIRVENSDGMKSLLTYGMYGQLVGLSSNSKTLMNFLGPNGRVDSTRIGPVADSLMTRFWYDTRGNITRRVSPDSRDTTIIFRQTGGLLNVDSIRQGGRTSRFRYDALGRLSSTTASDGRRDSLQFDVLNRTLAVQNNAGSWTRQEFSAAGLSAVVDANLQRYEFKSNAIGIDTALVDPRGQVIRSIFDARGLPRYSDNRRGQRIWSYSDSLGRLVAVVLPEGRQLGYAYDAAGRFVVASSPFSTDSVLTESDTLRREVSMRAGGLVFETTRRVSLTERRVITTTRLRSGAAPWTTHWYTDADSLWRVTSITPDGASSTTIGYGKKGVSDTIWIGGTAERAIINRRPNGQLESIAYNNQDLAYVYGRDSAGRVKFRTREVPNPQLTNLYAIRENYTYDAIGRLSSWARGHSGSTMCVIQSGPSTADGSCPTSSVTASAVYSYDAVGNPQAGAAVQMGNRLVTLGDTTMRYDPDGNLDSLQVPGKTLRYWWNSAGQLDSAWASTAGKVRYEYDGFGRRIARRTDTSMEHYVYFGADVMADVGGDGTWLARYSYYPGVDRPHSVTRNGHGTHWYVSDGRGNVRGLVNAAGALRANYELTPFGASVTQATSWDSVGNRYRFAGREWDAALELYYNRARYYHPGTRRFISQDPSGLGGGINPYVYASNDPVNFADPLGLAPCSVAEQAINGQTYTNDQGEEKCWIPTMLPPVIVFGTQGDDWWKSPSPWGFDLPSLGGNYGPMSTMPGLLPSAGSVSGHNSAAGSTQSNPQTKKQAASNPSCSAKEIGLSAGSGAAWGMVAGAVGGAFMGALAGFEIGSAVGATVGAVGGSAVPVLGNLAGLAAGFATGGVAGAVVGGIAGAAEGMVLGFAPGMAWGAAQEGVKCLNGGRDPFR